jgi:N-acetylglucosamine kinase-like BadF-type ATPase
MGVGATVIGVDGGNTKTDLVVAHVDGRVVGRVRGPGTNSHGITAEGCASVLADLARQVGAPLPVEVGAFFLCGADVPADVADLYDAITRRELARASIVENDTFALLHVGTDGEDAVAVTCGGGINCVGRSAAGRIVRYPSLGWETGDWGGSEMLGREALYLAARGADGRAEATVLTELIAAHFGLRSVGELGEAVHDGRVRSTRLGEVAPAILAAAAAGDAVATGLVERLATEIGLLVRRAFRDLGLDSGDVVLGGGMLAPAAGILHDRVIARLPGGARPVVLRDAPVVGAALAALAAAGAGPDAKRRLRAALRAG